MNIIEGDDEVPQRNIHQKTCSVISPKLKNNFFYLFSGKILSADHKISKSHFLNIYNQGKNLIIYLCLQSKTINI